MKKVSAEVLTAIDIGTTKICVIIAQPTADGGLHIMGVGHAPSAGLARGVVVSMAPAVHAIQMALREAELMAGVRVTHAVVGISGAHIRAYSSHGMVPVKQGIIEDYDIKQVIAAAQAISLPEGQQLLHAMPHYFCINGSEIVRDPRGMYGVRLEARVHIVTGSISSVHNIVRCSELAGAKAHDIVLEPIASAEAVLTNDERELGVGILDIGGGTSDFAIYQKGSICHTHIIPIAGNIFTHDIAVCLHTSLHDAERIKKEYGAIDKAALQQHEEIAVAHVDHTEQKIMREDLCAVLAARSEELLHMVLYEIESHGLRAFMPAGLVITGGGALLAGLATKATQILHMPVRIGKPVLVAGAPTLLANPSYATSYGLLLYAQKRFEAYQRDAQGTMVHRLLHTMKSWICDIF